jgi:hypothetical protein
MSSVKIFVVIGDNGIGHCFSNLAMMGARE